MEGPHHVHGWTGFDAIPDKQQKETQPGPGGPSAWPEPNWEAPMGFIYALTSVAFSDKDPPLRNNLDMARWGRETMHPRNYMNSTYFEDWLRSVARWLERSGLVTVAELTESFAGNPAIIDTESLNRAASIENAAKSEAVPGFGKPISSTPAGSATYPVYAPKSNRYQDLSQPENIRRLSPKFEVGTKVKAILQMGSGHTREYAPYRGKVGTVMAYYRVAKPGNYPKVAEGYAPGYQAGYPDIACRGLQEFLVPVYSVRFLASDIWGKDYVEPSPRKGGKQYVYADMFEPYIQAVSQSDS